MHRIAKHITDYTRQIKGFDRNAKLFLLGNILVMLSQGVFFVFFNLYLKKGELGEDIIGYLNSSQMWAPVIFALPMGLWVARMKLKKAFLISIPLTIVSLAASSLTLVPLVLVTMALMTGAAKMIFNAATGQFIMANSRQDNRHYVFAVYWAIYSFIAVIGSLIGGIIPDFLADWFSLSEFLSLRFSLFAVSLLTIFGMIPFAMLREKEGNVIKPKTTFPWRNWKTVKHYIRFPILHLAIGLGAGFIVPFFSIFFSEKFGLKPSYIGYIFAISAAGTGLMTLAMPLLARRLGKLWAIVIPQTISIPFILAIVYAPCAIVAVVVYWIRDILMNGTNPIANQIVMEETEEEKRPIISNINTLSWSGGWAITVAISGVLIKNYGYLPSYYCTFGIYIIHIILLFLFYRNIPGIRDKVIAGKEPEKKYVPPRTGTLQKR